jgi:uncharacterized membrane-anchored protein
VKKILIITGAILVLFLTNAFIYQKEEQRNNGRLALLRIAPIDPRSLAQGDYIRLSYDIAREAPRVERERDGGSAQPEGGFMIVKPDGDGIVHFVRLDDGADLAPDELRLAYTFREGRVSFGADAYFFQEGLADIYQKARYAEVRITLDGDCILLDLFDENFVPMGMESQPAA